MFSGQGGTKKGDSTAKTQGTYTGGRAAILHKSTVNVGKLGSLLQIQLQKHGSGSSIDAVEPKAPDDGSHGPALRGRNLSCCAALDSRPDVWMWHSVKGRGSPAETVVGVCQCGEWARFVLRCFFGRLMCCFFLMSLWGGGFEGKLEEHQPQDPIASGPHGFHAGSGWEEGAFSVLVGGTHSGAPNWQRVWAPLALSSDVVLVSCTSCLVD